MRYIPGDFTLVPNLDRLMEEHGTVVKVYLALCKMADSKTGTCYPKFETIAKGTKISLATAKRAVARLQKIGVLRVENRKRQTKQISNKYYIEILESSVTGVTRVQDKPSVTHDTQTITTLNNNHSMHGLRPAQRQKSMKNTEQVIELDEYGEPLPQREPKSKVPIQLIQKVALHYATLFNVPKENLYFKYKVPILEMVNLAKEYYGDDWIKIQDEIKLRIIVAKKYMEFKKWGKMKLATIAESWNEIPKWAKEIEI